MKTLPQYLALALLAALAVLFAVYVWPTPYNYFQSGTHTFRVNRFTGETKMLSYEGWR